MADEKLGDKGGSLTGDLAPSSLIAVLERTLRSLVEQARPILEEIRAIEQVLENAKNNQFLEERRQNRAAERQSANRGPDGPRPEAWQVPKS
jgi:hypothetical protein